MGITVWPVDAVAGAPSYTGRMARQTAGALVSGKTAARPLGGTSGLIAGTGSAVVSATTTTWTVGQCAGVIDGETSTAAGPYFFSNDTNVTGSMTAADATNARIDIISAQLSDPAEGDGTSTPGVAFVYTVGTAAASPVAPATPARSVTIAQINVPHSGAGSPSITDVAPRVVAAGGIQPCANSTTYPASPYIGQRVDDASLGGTLRWNGTIWDKSGTDTGWQTITLSAGFVLNTVQPAYRVKNGVVYFRGDVKPNAGNFAAGSGIQLTAAGAIPVGARPIGQDASESAVGGQSADSSVRGFVSATGFIQIGTGANTTAWIALKGLGGYLAEA